MSRTELADDDGKKPRQRTGRRTSQGTPNSRISTTENGLMEEMDLPRRGFASDGQSASDMT